MDRSHQKNPGQGLGNSLGEGQGKVSDARTTYYDDCIADLDSSGDLVRSYTYGPGIDNPLAMTTYSTETNTYYYLTDHLGSVLALTDEDGAIVESYEYDAFGRIKVFDGDFEEIAESAYGNRITFQGREYSWATGLYYFRARWYEPVTGRWLSKDPIGISGGLNQYVAFGGNGVNYVDPDGLRFLFAKCSDTGLSRREYGAWKKKMRDIIDRASKRKSATGNVIKLIDESKHCHIRIAYKRGVQKGTGNLTGGDITFDPFNMPTHYSDGSEVHAEDAFVHEFYHAFGKTRQRHNTLSGYEGRVVEETAATYWQNIHRDAMGVNPRTEYQGIPIPPLGSPPQSLYKGDD